MNHYLFNRESFNKFYNCSFYDINLHPIQERQDIFYGVILIIGSIIFELLYLPIIPVLWKPSFQKESCYKLMGIVAVVDMIAISLNGTLTGVLAITGSVYCSFPHIQLCAGTFAFAAWLMECDLALLLAIDRCLGMVNRKICDLIFTGKRIYLWIGFSAVYSFVVAFCTDTMTFNALYGVWLVNPHMGYPQTEKEYKNLAHHIHNIGIAFALAIFYLIFVLSLCKKKFSSQKQFSFSEKPIFIQVFLMSFMNFCTALIYVYEQHFPTPKLIMQFSQFGWMCIHGLPSVIYLGLNKRIRRGVFKLLRIPTNDVTSVAHQPTKVSKFRHSVSRPNKSKYELN